MDYAALLGVFGNLAAILTGLVAVTAYGHFLWERRQKRLRLEDHLRDEAGLAYSSQRTLLDLIAAPGMSEAEIIEAAARSKVIRRGVSADDGGQPIRIVLEYDTGDAEEDISMRPSRAQF
ncbi:hypothetical protein GOA58_29455 [Sinorhizobium meliloti]|uniref:hypothetical protein n=1 Tax=Rhizobium meliloti TaxID=382 RepID=UPI001297B329|nr:hypothetical protein [Sinorhizobium meliloti]MDW9451712.1 hypothetical protein [Sinorhizobium meliloti]MDW9662846.1 hypothetical protein [Sinorhizobium meliloti]MDX0052165.1 hypothetical protein [Sinorhizobium meliloti]MQW13106.1 hypothetical protein [Sinorhizobium meliloti]